ncbi:MAG: VOC family protein [Peptoniphilus sp.]|uniref:4-hydroxyphenylpyruvate dioxygenase C terminal domain protein n=2 Tax=Peptoniphilus indolicus TaxID=33030 RepID=G4D1S5_9FIRM|nr:MULTISPECIES: VOC family protein [Peptoniphilus]EGY80523.1 4-hydroxyphenylpyruvate dioxygenase C terminal domain protein [Peptoniphilus indolicus ATCC 29427]MDY2986360.1 VOC family protein [Peptoniphilus sp.]SUB75562.1 methylmalonyl-CoA epimerase [Peptoniphilus indolicus]
MKPMRMHHVGIVLPTLEEAYEMIERLGLEIDYKGHVDAYQAKLIFTKSGDHSSPIEFIIPEAGVLKDFNNGKGGIAHIAFEVDDVEAVRKEYEEKGLQMLEREAVPGTSDIIVNFLRPKYNSGILVEFVETINPIDREYNKF